jgi:hypothetical protein
LIEGGRPEGRCGTNKKPFRVMDISGPELLLPYEGGRGLPRAQMFHPFAKAEGR